MTDRLDDSGYLALIGFHSRAKRCASAIWAGVIEHLKVGAARGFLVSNQASLVSDLRSILSPQCVTRARQVAASMTKAAESVARAADLLEDAARPQDAPGRRAD